LATHHRQAIEKPVWNRLSPEVQKDYRESNQREIEFSKTLLARAEAAIEDHNKEHHCE
jgi:hypothetical protein